MNASCYMCRWLTRRTKASRCLHAFAMCTHNYMCKTIQLHIWMRHVTCAGSWQKGRDWVDVYSHLRCVHTIRCVWGLRRCESDRAREREDRVRERERGREKERDVFDDIIVIQTLDLGWILGYMHAFAKCTHTKLCVRTCTYNNYVCLHKMMGALQCVSACCGALQVLCSGW